MSFFCGADRAGKRIGGVDHGGFPGGRQPGGLAGGESGVMDRGGEADGGGGRDGGAVPAAPTWAAAALSRQ